MILLFYMTILLLCNNAYITRKSTTEPNMQDNMHTKQKSFEISDKALLYKYHDAFYKIFHLPLDWIPPDNRTFTVCGKAH